MAYSLTNKLRAGELLRSVIGSAAWDQYLKYGYVDIYSRNGKRRYRFVENSLPIVFQKKRFLWWTYITRTRLCIEVLQEHKTGIRYPREDEMVTLILACCYNERKFLWVCNRPGHILAPPAGW